ncbi:hypothetical protein ACIF6H_12060 [Streptomyces microflavus]|uniref:hypothetical protein n=1 Tax=Streptomyces microflavus TaxID=1919 RepID=UPI0037D95065
MLQNSPSGFRRRTIGAEIREIAPMAVLVRVYPARRSVTHLFESDFSRMLIDRRTEEEVARMVRRGFGKAADWRRAHDFYLPTETLYLTPEPYQNGFVPEDDQSFGLSLSRRIAIGDGDH